VQLLLPPYPVRHIPQPASHAALAMVLYLNMPFNWTTGRLASKGSRVPGYALVTSPAILKDGRSFCYALSAACSRHSSSPHIDATVVAKHHHSGCSLCGALTTARLDQECRSVMVSVHIWDAIRL
jgi:hypothetical protein